MFERPKGRGHNSWHGIVGQKDNAKLDPKTQYLTGTEILIFHCFCTMEMFLFSKSIIPDEISVKISRRIFLDRSQGLKCTKKLKKTLDTEAYFS